MKLSIALPVLAFLASTTAAPAAASQLSPTPKSCKVNRQNNNRAKSSTVQSTGAKTTTAKTTSATTISPSPAASSAASGGGGAPNSEIGKMLKLHDDFRAHYGKMTWSNELADFAQSVANTCKFEHSHGPYGENLAVGVGGGYNVEKAFTSWSDESKDYDWNNPGFDSKTGHFTQVVWKDTSELGCASALCDDGTIFTGYGAKSLYVVCEYRKQGNVVNKNNQAFRDNVGTYRA